MEFEKPDRSKPETTQFKKVSESSYLTKIFCPIIKNSCEYSRKTGDYWYCKVGDYEMKNEKTPCKKGRGQTMGAQNFSFTLYDDGSAKISKSNKPKEIVELSRNQVLDIYDDLTQFYDTSYSTKIIKMKNGSFMVSQDVAEDLKLRGMTVTPTQGFMGVSIIVSTPELQNYLEALYLSSQPIIKEEDLA